MVKKFDINRYKKHTGERGSPEAWKSKAERLLGRVLSVDESLVVLGLRAPPTTLLELKKAYHKAIMVAHPDRGGSAEQAANNNKAYENLVKTYFS